MTTAETICRHQHPLEWTAPRPRAYPCCDRPVPAGGHVLAPTCTTTRSS